MWLPFHTICEAWYSAVWYSEVFAMDSMIWAGMVGYMVWYSETICMILYDITWCGIVTICMVWCGVAESKSLILTVGHTRRGRGGA